MKSAMRLERQGWPDAMGMTPGQVLFRSRFGVDEEKADFKRSASSTRIAGAKKEDWAKAFLKEDDRT